MLIATHPLMLDAQGPAFFCTKARGQVEQLVCKDAALAALDRKLDEVFKAALARDNMPAILGAEQRGWIGGRNECWKAQGPDTPVFLTASWRVTSVRECVEAQYQDAYGRPSSEMAAGGVEDAGVVCLPEQPGKRSRGHVLRHRIARSTRRSGRDTPFR